jgi:hypothetical protein
MARHSQTEWQSLRSLPAHDAAKNSGAAALNVLASGLLFNNRQIILARAAALPLPRDLSMAHSSRGGLVGTIVWETPAQLAIS